MGFITDDGKAIDRFFPCWIDSMRRISRAPIPDARSQVLSAQAAPGGAYFIGGPGQVA
jgi:hypothetical protein